MCAGVCCLIANDSIAQKPVSLNSFPHKTKHNEAPFKVYEIYHTKIPLLVQALFDILVSVRALGQNIHAGKAGKFISCLCGEMKKKT